MHGHNNHSCLRKPTVYTKENFDAFARRVFSLGNQSAVCLHLLIIYCQFITFSLTRFMFHGKNRESHTGSCKNMRVNK